MSITLNQLLFICIPSGLALYGAFWLGMVHAEKKLHQDARQHAFGIIHLLKEKDFKFIRDEIFASQAMQTIALIEKFIKSINLTKND